MGLCAPIHPLLDPGISEDVVMMSRPRAVAGIELRLASLTHSLAHLGELTTLGVESFSRVRNTLNPYRVVPA